MALFQQNNPGGGQVRTGRRWRWRSPSQLNSTFLSTPSIYCLVRVLKTSRVLNSHKLHNKIKQMSQQTVLNSIINIVIMANMVVKDWSGHKLTKIPNQRVELLNGYLWNTLFAYHEYFATCNYIWSWSILFCFHTSVQGAN